MGIVRMVLVRYWNLMYVLMYVIKQIYQIPTNMIKIIIIFNIILIQTLITQIQSAISTLIILILIILTIIKIN